jgi:hypothetical protein
MSADEARTHAAGRGGPVQALLGESGPGAAMRGRPAAKVTPLPPALVQIAKKGRRRFFRIDPNRPINQNG